MKREWTAIVLVGAVLTTGCVSNKKYQEALAEADNVKMELEKTRQQKSAMEQQVRTLKELNVKFGNEAQAARDLLHCFGLRIATHAGNRDTHVHRRANARIEEA